MYLFFPGKLRKKLFKQETLFEADPLDKGDIFTYQVEGLASIVFIIDSISIDNVSNMFSHTLIM